MNCIIVLLDSLRADHVGCYGNRWIRTPALDSLAEESITFTRAYPESLPTLPMRRTLHTGLRTWPFRGWIPQRGDIVRAYGWQRIPEDQTTLAEVLNGEGYQTGFITDTYHQFKPSMNFHRGFSQWRWVRGQEMDSFESTLPIGQEQVDRFIPPRLSEPRQQLLRGLLTRHLANQQEREREEDYQAPRVFREAMRWLEQNRRAGKFFLIVDSFDPHEPWDPPREYAEMYDPGYKGQEFVSPSYGRSDYLSEEELKHMRALYAGEVTMVDRWLGRFLELARSLGMLEDTLLIVTSDHGHQLGEHGLTGKVSRGLWCELMDVPLFVRSPDGQLAGRRADAFAQHQDIVPTVVATLGVEPPASLDGVDLIRLAKGQVPPREYVVSGFNNYVWYRDERWVYIGRNDGRNTLLFDIEKDPLQENDLSEEERGVAERIHQGVVEEAGGPLPVYTDVLAQIDVSWYRV